MLANGIVFANPNRNVGRRRYVDIQKIENKVDTYLLSALRGRLFGHATRKKPSKELKND